MNAKITAGLRHAYPAVPNQLDRLDLELSTEFASLHDHLPLDKTPNPGVHQTGSSADEAFRGQPCADAGRLCRLSRADFVLNAGTERKLVIIPWGVPRPRRTGGPPVTNVLAKRARLLGALQ